MLKGRLLLLLKFLLDSKTLLIKSESGYFVLSDEYSKIPLNISMYLQNDFGVEDSTFTILYGDLYEKYKEIEIGSFVKTLSNLYREKEINILEEEIKTREQKIICQL